MNELIQLPILEAVHNNQYLFSDHYLNHLLPNDPRWAEALPAAETFLAWLTERYAQEEAHLPDYSEAQLEEHWIKPILTQLGHIYEPQAVIPGLQSHLQRPDYVFFATEADRQAAVGSQNTADYAAHALAVGDAKKWGIPLGKKIKGGGASFEYQNPSFQIDTYLRSTNLAWGILTNGQKWRLVNRASSYRLTTYYEIDLMALLAEGEVGPLRYFTLFFRQAAFKPDAQGHCFLDDALAASQAYAVALEEDVRENVYHALEKLLQGFLDLPTNGLTVADLPLIFENSLILLYRLIFILYGESRGLLPMQNSLYRDQYSLHHLKKKVAQLQQQEKLPPPMIDLRWHKIKLLFQIINGDNAPLNQYLTMPRYNGNLFDPRQHPFLAEKGVGDRALVEAINLLSLRRTQTGQLEFVDYRTLGVRQLGSIYEGLLEYQPRFATSPMVAIRDNQSKAGRWLEKSKAPQTATILDERAAGEIYLETDRGERKTTGSYYTPQYIVEYIVDNTVGPLVEMARQRVKTRANDAADPVATKEAEQTFIDEILSLKILDPAMGSGHFLVEATEYLARTLATDPYITTEEESPTEEDLTVWKRRVVERCIYGVDKNPLAVELAKLSLWLTTVAAEKPLSFLDHHLKCGDALVGARIEDLGWSPPVIFPKKELKTLAELKAGQMNQFGYLLSQHLPTMMGKILEITQTESDSYDTVQAKDATDQAVAEMKAPFEALANLWVSAYFGHHVTRNDYELEGLNRLHQPAELLALPAVREAQRLATEHHFFHWELAFPEVFYDENGHSLADRAGFDVVVGNPPYIRSIRLKETDPDAWAYYNQNYEVAKKWEYDIYLCFVEQGLNLINGNSQLGMIMPNKWFTTQVGKSLRNLLAQKSAVRSIVDFGSFQVFKEATTYTCLLFLSGLTHIDISIFILTGTPRNNEPLPGRAGDWQTTQIKSDTLGPNAWQLVAQPTETLLTKLSNLPTLEKIADVFAGAGTRADQVFFMERQGNLYFSRSLDKWVELEDDLMYPGLTGRDVFRYGYETKNVLLFPYIIQDNEAVLIGQQELKTKYPKIWAYLNQPKNRIQLENRDRGAFHDVEEWYAYGRPQNMHRLDREKIVGPDVANQATFTCDFEGRFIIDTMYAIRPKTDSSWDLKALVALLNSQLLTFFLQQTGTNLRGGYFRMKTAYLNPFPIPHIDVTTPAGEREQLVAQSQMLYQSGETEALLAFSQARLDVEPAQSDVVHDLLAYLAGQMIDLNRQKQQNTENFWLDLEGVTDIDTFPKLRHKGKWESTLWKQTSCRPYVSSDSRATRNLAESLAWDEAAYKAFIKLLAGNITGMSKVVQLYRQHGPAYRQVEQTLATTDRLIDRLVYQLYGLMAEEIAIVEGTM